MFRPIVLTVAADVGFYVDVEVVGTVDKSGKALSITSVKRLKEQGPGVIG